MAELIPKTKVKPNGLVTTTFDEVPSIGLSSYKGTAGIAIGSMTVTITSGKTFHADPEARVNIISSILAASFTGLTSVNWRLVGNKDTVTVTLDELNEANLLALTEFGNIIGVG